MAADPAAAILEGTGGLSEDVDITFIGVAFAVSVRLVAPHVVDLLSAPPSREEKREVAALPRNSAGLGCAGCIHTSTASFRRKKPHPAELTTERLFM